MLGVTSLCDTFARSCLCHVVERRGQRKIVLTFDNNKDGKKDFSVSL